MQYTTKVYYKSVMVTPLLFPSMSMALLQMHLLIKNTHLGGSPHMQYTKKIHGDTSFVPQCEYNLVTSLCWLRVPIQVGALHKGQMMILGYGEIMVPLCP